MNSDMNNEKLFDVNSFNADEYETFYIQEVQRRNAIMNRITSVVICLMLLALQIGIIYMGSVQTLTSFVTVIFVSLLAVLQYFEINRSFY